MSWRAITVPRIRRVVPVLLHELRGVQAIVRFYQQGSVLGLHTGTPSRRTLIMRGLSSRSNRSAEMKV
jgi:hypothetical protein